MGGGEAGRVGEFGEGGVGRDGADAGDGAEYLAAGVQVLVGGNDRVGLGPEAVGPLRQEGDDAGQ